MRPANSETNDDGAEARLSTTSATCPVVIRAVTFSFTPSAPSAKILTCWGVKSFGTSVHPRTLRPEGGQHVLDGGRDVGDRDVGDDRRRRRSGAGRRPCSGPFDQHRPHAGGVGGGHVRPS